MMNQVLKDIKEAGYSEAVLWMFRENHRVKAFYEAKGFTITDISKPAFDTEEVLYSKRVSARLCRIILNVSRVKQQTSFFLWSRILIRMQSGSTKGIAIDRLEKFRDFTVLGLRNI